MNYLRWLLFPFSVLYGLVVFIRNSCYDIGLFKSRGFDMPIISVGNLDVGGSGKTPMTEYLIRMLMPNYQLATLSRGYGRAKKGWVSVTENSLAIEVGDEPLQLKHKFPKVTVAVYENRVAGAERLKDKSDVIILDDAYQHRAIKPGFSILLFDYSKFKGINLLLPAGNRRELFTGRKRANVIIITKCPVSISTDEQQRMLKKVAPYPHQQVFFTTIAYQGLQNKNSGFTDNLIEQDTTVFLLTGIANPLPMYQYIAEFTRHIIHHNYPDHHRFSLKNIAKLAAEFEACKADKKIIITTEKDMQRLGEQELLSLTYKLPIYTLPIGVEFLNNGAQQFNETVKNYVRQYTTHGSIY